MASESAAGSVRTWLVVALASAIALTGQPEMARAAGGGASEYRIKAAFLFNFTRFVEWPDQPEPESLLIGVVGKDPFGSALEDTMNGKSAHGVPISVRRFGAGDDLSSCRVLFISASERKRVADILETLGGAQVLTVSESDQFLEHGGMINFVIEERSVRIDVNLEAARNAGLILSSQLLKAARRVERDVSASGGSR